MPKIRKKRFIHYALGIVFIAAVLGLSQIPAIKNLFSSQHPHKTTQPSIIHSLPKKYPTTKVKAPTSSNGVSQGSSTTINNPPVTTSPNQWTVSQSGVITLKEPTNNQTIASGAIISGSATVTNVGYTLIDNQVGVISQGNIPVKNGTFSAKISFKSYATGGRLDVYSTTPSGKEENLIEISVSF